MFGKLLKLGKMAYNNISYYVGRLSHGIKNVAYKFIVRPIASILISIFNFARSLIMLPVNFMKWLIPSILDRVFDAFDTIKQAMKAILRSTYSIFKKILFNPISIALIIGALIYFLAPKLISIVSGGFKTIRKNIVNPIISVAKSVFSFLSAAWRIVSTVGKFLFDIVEYITRPTGIIGKTILTVLKYGMAIKSGIVKLIKTTGKSSVDTLCMFLAGDYIGIALHATIGMLGKFWQWLKGFGLFRRIVGLIKTILLFGEMLLTF